MVAPASSPRASTTFLVLTFGVAIAVGVLVAYLGITGQIGAGIP
jgi:hypothetical protein